MSSNYIDLPVEGGGGGGGVTSLNGLTGGVNLIAGPSITITPIGNNIQISSSALPTALISLNGSTFANQTLTVGTAGTDFNISDNNPAGIHTFNLPTASATNRGALSSADWSTFNSKQSVISIGALDAQAANANGLALVSNVLSTQSATPSFPGMVNTTQQSFGGNKTFVSIGINDVTSSAGLFVRTSDIATPSQTIKALAGQTANLLQILDTSSNVIMQFTAGGNFQFYNSVASPEARFDIRPSVNQAACSTGANARYGMFVGDPLTPEVGGDGSGIALGGMYDNIGTATEFGYIWVTKNNSTAGNIDSSMHFATRNNASGKAQRVLDMDNNSNSTFFGAVIQAGATSGTLTTQVPATITSYAVTRPSAQGAANTVEINDGAGNLSWGLVSLSAGVTGTLPIGKGGTGQTTAASARGPSGLNIDERTTVNATGYSAVNTDRYVAQTGTMSAPITITLPAASSVNPGQTLLVEDESGTVTATNYITVAASGADTINGAASSRIAEAYGGKIFISNGTNAWSSLVAGIRAGGTGLSSIPTNGQLLIGNGTNYTLSTLTAGAGISVTNAAGSITVANTSQNTATKTANYTMVATDSIIFCDTSGGAFTLTLPSPSTVTGRVFKIIDSTGSFNTNNLTLARSASEKIEGLAASKVLQTAWGWFNVVSNGTDWFVG